MNIFKKGGTTVNRSFDDGVQGKAMENEEKDTTDKNKKQKKKSSSDVVPMSTEEIDAKIQDAVNQALKERNRNQTAVDREPPLTDKQKDVKAEADYFSTSTAVLSHEQLRTSIKNKDMPTMSKFYGTDAESEDEWLESLPNWTKENREFEK